MDGEQHIKTKLLDELDLITTALLEEAKKGGTAPLKLLWQLGKLNQDATATLKKHEPTLSSMLMQDLREKQALKKQKGLPEK